MGLKASLRKSSRWNEKCSDIRVLLGFPKFSVICRVLLVISKRSVINAERYGVSIG